MNTWRWLGVKRSTAHTHTHTIAEQTTHTTRARCQRETGHHTNNTDDMSKLNRSHATLPVNTWRWLGAKKNRSPHKQHIQNVKTTQATCTHTRQEENNKQTHKRTERPTAQQPLNSRRRRRRPHWVSKTKRSHTHDTNSTRLNPYT